MCLLYGLESALGDLFFKDKVSNTAVYGGIAIGSNSNTLQARSSDGVGGMQYQINSLNQEIIGHAGINVDVDIAQHLTDEMKSKTY